MSSQIKKVKRSISLYLTIGGRPKVRLSRSHLFAVVTLFCRIVISACSLSQFGQYDPNYTHVNMDHVTHCRIHTTLTTTTNATSNPKYKG